MRLQHTQSNAVQDLALLGVKTYRRIKSVRDAFVNLLEPGAFRRLYVEERAKAASLLSELDGHLRAMEAKVLTAKVVYGTACLRQVFIFYVMLASWRHTYVMLLDCALLRTGGGHCRESAASVLADVRAFHRPQFDAV